MRLRERLELRRQQCVNCEEIPGPITAIPVGGGRYACSDRCVDDYERGQAW